MPAAIALLDHKVSYNDFQEDIKGSTPTRDRRVFNGSYAAGGIIFISDEDNTNTQDQSYPAWDKQVPNQKQLMFAPTLRKTVTQLRIRPTKAAIVDGIKRSDLQVVDFLPYADLYGTIAANVAWDIVGGVSKYCTDSSTQSLRWQSASNMPTSTHLSQMKAAILAQYPSYPQSGPNSLAEMEGWQAFCFPVGYEVSDPTQLSYNVLDTSISGDPCDGDILQNKYAAYTSKATPTMDAHYASLMKAHWYYGSLGSSPASWTLKVGAKCQRGRSFNLKSESVKTVKNELKSGAVTLEEAILYKAQKIYGSASRFLFGAIVPTLTSSCPVGYNVTSNATKTEYEKLVAKHAAVAGTGKSFVEDICASEFNLSEDLIKNFVTTIAQRDYDITSLLQSGDTLEEVTLIRNSTKTILTSSQYTLAGKVLQFPEGFFKAGDQIILKIKNTLARSN